MLLEIPLLNRRNALQNWASATVDRDFQKHYQVCPLLSELVSQILSPFDIRTIIACQLILSTVFAIVFLCLSFTYRKQQGPRSIAFAFLISVPGLLLTTLRGALSDVSSTVVANLLIMSVYLFIYSGVLQF
jgi:hypothetical protein